MADSTAVQNLSKLTRGDTKTYNLTIKYKSSGLPVDISGWKFYFTLKEDYSDSDEDAKIKKEWEITGDGTTGKTSFTLEHSDTDDLQLRDFYYDIQIKKPSGEVRTYIKGELPVRYDVSRGAD